jgi:hypothetical protein
VKPGVVDALWFKALPLSSAVVCKLSSDAEAFCLVNAWTALQVLLKCATLLVPGQ